MAKVERASALYLIGGLAVVVLGVVLSLIVLPGPDLLWRLYIAEGLLNGKVMYRDLLEVNPPLWFWAALPAAWLGQDTPILAYHALIGLNMAVMVSATFLLFHLAKKTLGPSTAAAGFMFGQRWRFRSTRAIALDGLWLMDRSVVCPFGGARGWVADCNLSWTYKCLWFCA
jgi:hypothetical protein